MKARRSYADATLIDFLRDLWRARRALAVGGLIGLGAGILFLTLAVPHYRAAMIVGPADSAAPAAPDEDKPAAITAGPPGFARFEALLRGPSVAAALHADPALTAGIKADRRWRFGTGPETDTAADIADYLNDHVRIEPVGDAVLRRVIYDHPDPDFAVRLLRALHGAADGLIHEESRAQAGESVAYLAEALARAQNPDHRRALTGLLMGQEQARVLLGMDRAFAAAIAEPPAAGARPHWPRPALVLPVTVLAGLALGFALFCLRRDPA